MKLLHLDSSILGAASVTRELGADVVDAWRQAHPDLEVIHRDLAANPPAHLEVEILNARGTDSADRSPRQVRELAMDEDRIAELRSADVLVIGAPMYNFSVPTQLKAWLDRVLVAGETFRYTAGGPEGLLPDRPVIVVSGRGGVYSSGAGRALDFQEAYLRAAFGLIGIHDLRVIRAEGVALGAEARRKALAQARIGIGRQLAAAA